MLLSSSVQQSISTSLFLTPLLKWIITVSSNTIVICCDGTTNTSKSDTNVYRLSSYLVDGSLEALSATHTRPVKYFKGVGSSIHDRISGSAWDNDWQLAASLAEKDEGEIQRLLCTREWSIWLLTTLEETVKSWAAV